jgi:hypothetical protein
MYEQEVQDRFQLYADVYAQLIHFAGGCEGKRLDGQCQRFKNLVMKFLIFPTPIRFHTVNFCVKETLNMRLKLHKNVLSFKTVMHKINPCELDKIINKAYIIFVATNRYWGRPPNIRKYEFKQFGRAMNRNSIW